MFTRLILFLAAILLSVPAFAHPCRGTKSKDPCETVLRCNPDGRTSITLTGGIGDLDGMDGSRSADVQTLSVAVVHPVSRDLSLLAGYSHSDAEWNGAASLCGLDDWDVGVFTVGVRFYLGR